MTAGPLPEVLAEFFNQGIADDITRNGGGLGSGGDRGTG